MIGEASPINPADGDARQWTDISRRVAELERKAQHKLPAPSCGFHVTRTTNDSAVGASSTLDITFNNVVEATWSTFAGFTSGAGITVPAEGAGLYIVSGGAYWVTSVAGIYAGVALNATQIAPAPTPSLATDRAYFSGVARLAVGDILRLHIANLSGTSITPTQFSGDSLSPALQFLKAWRIST